MTFQCNAFPAPGLGPCQPWLRFPWSSQNLSGTSPKPSTTLPALSEPLGVTQASYSLPQTSSNLPRTSPGPTGLGPCRPWLLLPWTSQKLSGASPKPSTTLPALFGTSWSYPRVLQPAKNLLKHPQDLSRTHQPGALPAVASPPMDLPKPSLEPLQGPRPPTTLPALLEDVT